MRIVIDMQGAQTESRFRGIGRYTLSFAKAVARNRGDHEIILALSGLFPETIEPIRAAFSGLLPQKNIRVWHAPGPVCEGQPGNDTRREIAELIREAFLASLEPDVIHVGSLFEGYVDDAVTSIGRFDTSTPVSVTIYDLIPLLNSGKYFKSNPRYQEFYHLKLQYLRSAAIGLCISESSRKEAIEALNLDDGKIINVSTAIDSHFHPLVMDDAAADRLCGKFGIHRPFMLYAGGCDERKNLPRLIRAYASLPAGLRAGHQLVFAGRMPDGDVARLRHVARAAGLKDSELVYTGYVTDEELVRLYNLCRLFVFPSWHEGFGLPALEAMACGAPVIAANTSSLPEVIGLDEALFDPFDVAAIASKMAQALEDESFRDTLREHGLKQAKKFSWDETAKRALERWKELNYAQSKEFCAWRRIRKKLADIHDRLVQSIAAMTSVTDDAQLRRIAVCLERNERQIDCWLRPRRLPSQITWRIEGPFDSSYSLALVNREIARALDSLGHRVVLHSTEGPGDFPANEQFLQENQDLAVMHARASEVPHIDSDVVSRNLYPPRVADMTSRFNFLHAYGWEESGFPLDWVDSFNIALQGMTVMSEHVRKVMVDHGVTVPVLVSGLGVDHWERIQPDESFHIDAKGFRFLHVSSCFPRKGVDVLLRAYGRAFRAADDVTLVIKTFTNPHNEIHRWLDEARGADPAFPDVLILNADYSDAQLKALYEQCDVLVAPSRAEGFGLPMAEAMLSGLAVITTGWSGQLDFCTPETAWLIDYKFEPSQTHFELFSSVWAEPDEMHLAALMKKVYQLPKEDRHIRIAAGQRLLNEKFRWEHVARRMVDAARVWARGSAIAEPRIGWVTTWNTRCGIAAYSAHLIRNMPANITVLAAQSDLKSAEDDPNVRYCWKAGDDDLVNLSAVIQECRIDTLVIQFNYGFFEFEIFGHFLSEQIAFGRVVVIIMHSTNDPKHVPDKKLDTLVPALRRCHRVLVHSHNDMNRLKQLGLVDNVTLFPHGLVDYKQVEMKRSQPSKNIKGFTVASYGFFLPHKGLIELIDAISLLRDKGYRVRLEMINAEYPIPESKDIIGQAHARIRRLGLQDIVSVCTDFLSDQESLSKLSKADLIVFPYQETGESSSAAVRYGIASGRPVAVTPLKIFDDVKPVVHQLPGCSPADIAEGIAELIRGITKTDERFLQKEKLAGRWREQHRYSRISLRLYNMLTALKNYA